jgi:hypothetical protein
VLSEGFAKPAHAVNAVGDDSHEMVQYVVPRTLRFQKISILDREFRFRGTRKSQNILKGLEDALRDSWANAILFAHSVHKQYLVGPEVGNSDRTC